MFNRTFCRNFYECNFTICHVVVNTSPIIRTTLTTKANNISVKVSGKLFFPTTMCCGCCFILCRCVVLKGI